MVAEDRISDLFSIRYDFVRFPRFIDNPFCFCYIMESRFLFFVTDPVFQSNSPYSNGIERLDILTLNNELLCFVRHNGEPRPPFSPGIPYFNLTLLIRTV